jgi:hypothetical protein
MESINLATQTSSSEPGGEQSSLGSGLLGAIIIFVLVLLLWGGLFFWDMMLSKKITDIQAQYSQKYDGFVKSDAIGVVDFKDRLNLAKDLSNKNINIRETLDKIESLLISPDVWLASYKYGKENGTIVLSCRTKNYEVVARQILSFKKSDYFSSVSGGKTQLDKTTGIITFEVDLKLK